jgi:hypothetical protein
MLCDFSLDAFQLYDQRPVNLAHNLFSPSNCIRYRADRRRNAPAAIVLSKFPGRKDGSGNEIGLNCVRSDEAL